jgi:hypothetical protein
MVALPPMMPYIDASTRGNPSLQQSQYFWIGNLNISGLGHAPHHALAEQSVIGMVWGHIPLL